MIFFETKYQYKIILAKMVVNFAFIKIFLFILEHYFWRDTNRISINCINKTI